MSCRRVALGLAVASTSSAVWYCVVLCIAASACVSRRIDLGRDPLGGGADSGKLDAASPGLHDAAHDAAITAPIDAALAARCGNRPCACNNGLDDDHDGLIDGLDPECTGALDEDEATFATGKASKVKNCRDCFWDEDQGTGNDLCRYPSACLRGEEPASNGNCGSCEVEPSCVATCRARTPNGCDCFGCCAISRPNAVTVSIELSDRCSLDKIGDTAACPRCTQSTQCRNECGRCELCPGRSLSDLPADCHAGTPPNRCDEGQHVCATSSDCTTDQYCQLGCCFASLL
jgi:hypothetical protein